MKNQSWCNKREETWKSGEKKEGKQACGRKEGDMKGCKNEKKYIYIYIYIYLCIYKGIDWLHFT